MLFNAKNGTLPLGDASMDYIRFGTGKRDLILLPGLGDGLKTVKGTALPMAAMYRLFATDFTVWCFSRKEPPEPGCTTRDMARDLKQAIDLLGIDRADLLGASMGGMIAQHFAAEYPETVNHLVLAVTCPCPNPLLEESIGEWVSHAQAGDHTALMESNVRRIYSDGYYRKNKWLIPLMGRLTKPRSYNRFLTQAHACLTHNALDRLSAIQAPTLVIGGEQDRALGAEPSRRIAAVIPGAVLKMYPNWGHGVYEESPDFNRTVFDFLLS